MATLYLVAATAQAQQAWNFGQVMQVTLASHLVTNHSSQYPLDGYESPITNHRF
ncbi:MAG: hypothetical protein Q8K18_13950 [Burkholderiales bacterium]|nr:hypothetical protein [Burkholderiales bacterium]